MRALVALFLIGCAGDPCDGVSGTCLSARVEGNVGMLDQLAFTVDGLGTMNSPMPAGASFSLPVRVAVQLPASVGTSAGITVSGLSAGKPIATSGHQTVPLMPNARSSHTFTLVGGAVDLGSGGLDGGNGDGPPGNVVSVSPTTATIPDVARNGVSGRATFTITNATSMPRMPTNLVVTPMNAPFTFDSTSTCPHSGMSLAALPAMSSCTVVLTAQTQKSGSFSQSVMVTFDDNETISFTVDAKVTPIWVGENLPNGATANLTAVWGSGPNDIYAVSDDQTRPIWHSTGQGQWSIESPNTGCLVSLHTIFGTDPNNIWAGGGIPGGGGQLCRWIGTDWSLATLPTSAQVIRGVWASSPTDIYAVDSSGQTFHSSDGATFVAESRAAMALDAIWGADATHVWVAGTMGYVALRDSVNPPNPWLMRTTGTTVPLSAMWAEPSTDLFVVGQPPGANLGGTIVHINLATSQPSLETPGNSIGSLNGISGRVDPMTHKPDIYVVGQLGNQVLHSAGDGNWHQIQLNDGNNQVMNGVWVFDDGSAIAVGFMGQMHHLY